MAKAKKLPSGAWRVQAYAGREDGKNKYISFTAPTKEEAEFLAAQYKVNPQKTSGLLLKDAMSEYISNRKNILSPRTIAEYKRSAKKDFIGLEDIRISKLTNTAIQKHINAISSGKSPKTVKNIYNFLSAVMRNYRRDFVLDVKLPSKVKPSLYIPNENEIKALLEYPNEDYKNAVLLSAFCSLRRGEISALQKEDIIGSTIHVSKAMVLNENRKWIIKPPKTYESNRTIDAPAFVIESLLKNNGRVNLTPDQITKTHRYVLKKLGLPHFRFHDLRHYHASILHALGFPDKYIMERGGWANSGTLKNIYQHTMASKNQELNDVATKYFEKISHEISHEK